MQSHRIKRKIMAINMFQKNKVKFILTINQNNKL